MNHPTPLMSGLYILGGDDGRTPIPTANVHEWALHLENIKGRRVATTRIWKVGRGDDDTGPRIYTASWFRTEDDVALAPPVNTQETGPERALVSTVFLGVDHRLDGDRDAPDYQPHVFESMIFWDGDDLHNEQRRTATWAMAELEHRRLVKLVALTMLFWDDGPPKYEDADLDTWPDMTHHLLRRGEPRPADPSVPTTVLITDRRTQFIDEVK